MDRRKRSYVNELEGNNRELGLAYIELEAKNGELEQEALLLRRCAEHILAGLIRDRERIL